MNYRFRVLGVEGDVVGGRFPGVSEADANCRAIELLD
jgi:hypothetical protein